MHKKIIIVCQILFFVGFLPLSLKAGGDPTATVDAQTSASLKKYMSKFGTLMAGVEVLRIKEKQIDWDSIDLTLNEMVKALNEMQLADKTNAYKAYTDLLSSQLTDLKKQSQQKNKNIYDGFGKLSHTCFGCHAAHRPSDFLVPKGKSTANVQ